MLSIGAFARLGEISLRKNRRWSNFGPLDTLLESYEDLARWIQDSGHTMSGRCRELYLQWSDTDAQSHIIELQMLLAC